MAQIEAKVDAIIEFVLEWAQSQDETAELNIDSLFEAAGKKFPDVPSEQLNDIISSILQQFLGGGEEGEFDDFPWGEGEGGFPFGFGEGEGAFNFGF